MRTAKAWASLLVAAAWEPKSNAAGASVTAGAMPSPLSATMAPPSLSPKKAMYAALGPASCGRNRTRAVQLADGISSVPVQFSESSWKLAESPPATMPMKNPAGMLPELVSSIVWISLVVPTVVGPNWTGFGVASMTARPPSPLRSALKP